jgi:hypothetical protein
MHFNLEFQAKKSERDMVKFKDFHFLLKWTRSLKSPTLVGVPWSRLRRVRDCVNFPLFRPLFTYFLMWKSERTTLLWPPAQTHRTGVIFPAEALKVALPVSTPTLHLAFVIHFWNQEFGQNPYPNHMHFNLKFQAKKSEREVYSHGQI